MVLEGDLTPGPVDLALLKAAGRARRWSDDLLSGRVKSVRELAKGEGMGRRSVQRLLRLGFLSLKIVEAVAEGRQPRDLTVISSPDELSCCFGARRNRHSASVNSAPQTRVRMEVNSNSRCRVWNFVTTAFGHSLKTPRRTIHVGAAVAGLGSPRARHSIRPRPGAPDMPQYLQLFNCAVWPPPY